MKSEILKLPEVFGGRSYKENLIYDALFQFVLMPMRQTAENPTLLIFFFKYIRDKVFKNGPCKICGRQHLKNLKEHGLFKQTRNKLKIVNKTVNCLYFYYEHKKKALLNSYSEKFMQL